MSPTSSPQSQPQVSGGRLRNAATGGLFALVLIVPRIMHLRRNPRSWMFFRVFLGIVGAALVLLPLGLGSSFVPAIVGLARSEEHTSELQSHHDLVCRLLLEK